tara:strand:- start:110 stop:904 length:795 start_codon:yes stop_codon:yes gene_type:complete
MTTTLKIPRPSTLDRSSKTYTINGESYHRVTTVLGILAKPALVPWATKTALAQCEEALLKRTGAHITDTEIKAIIKEARKKPDQARDKAADFGSLAHDSIEHYIDTGTMPVEPEFQRVVIAYDEWRTANNLQIDLTENLVWDEMLGYGGTVDAIGYKQIPLGTTSTANVLVLADWKTGGLYREAYLQVAAYAHALEMMTGEIVHEAWTVRIPRDAPKEGEASFQAHKLTRQHILDNFKLFESALSLYKMLGDGWSYDFKGVLHE